LEVIGFERYDKGDISDTEAQVGNFLLTTPKPKAVASPEFCRKFNNDSVKCQASDVCGWCQLVTSGFCYEPGHKPACNAFGGAWVGPEDGVTPATDKAKSNFISIQHEQQLKGHYPVVVKGL
jgi:hypothetical protein